ncbi:MAG: hypothetical protein KBB55_02585 [Candidatus Buchananbacteria bacterium]|nr:hypothetical protein [Candidatus Buchananbacteria bacterium]
MANLDRIINLIKKTGDKVIVVDEQGNPSYTLMALADYEQLVLGKSEVYGLTEEELIAKINRDIAVWKDAHGDGDLERDVEDLDFADSLSDIGTPAAELAREMAQGSDFRFNLADSEAIEEDHYYFEPVE